MGADISHLIQEPTMAESLNDKLRAATDDVTSALVLQGIKPARARELAEAHQHRLLIAGDGSVAALDARGHPYGPGRAPAERDTLSNRPIPGTQQFSGRNFDELAQEIAASAEPDDFVIAPATAADFAEKRAQVPYL